MNSLISIYIASFLLPLIIVLGVTPVLKRFALRFGFVDMPSSRKVHYHPIPLGGGIGVYFSFMVAFVFIIIFLHQPLSGTIIGIIAGATLLVIVGVMDDFLDLDYLTKLLGQGVSAFIFLVFLNVTSPYMAIPVQLTVMILWIMSLENAMNFLDNMDGLCAGISLITSIGFGVLFLFKEMPVYTAISFATAGAALGFLRYNLTKASIFLGDGGSLFFGFVLSCLGLVHLNSSKNLISALVPMLVVSYPFFDLLFVTVSRLKEGRKLYIGGTDHSSHKMNVMGFSKRKTVFVIHSINIVLGIMAIILFLRQDSPFYSLIIVFFGFIMAFIGVHLYRNFLFLGQRIMTGFMDLAAVNISLVLFYIIKYEMGILRTSILIPFKMLLAPMIWISLFWLFLFAIIGLYEIPIEVRLRSRMFILLKSITIGTVIFLIVNYKPGDGFQISLSSIAVFVILLFVISSGLRAAMYKLISFKLSADNQRLNAVIVSSREPRDDTLKATNSYNILGYVGPNGKSENTWLGELSELDTILKNTNTARVILDLDDSDYIDLRNVFNSSYFMETIFLTSKKATDNLVGLKRYPTVNKGLDIISIRHRRLFPMIFQRLANAIFSLALAILFSPYWIFKILSRKIKNEKVFDDITIMTQLEREIKIKRFKGDDKLSLTNPWIIYAIFRGKFNLYGVTIDSPDEYKASFKSLPGYWRKFLIKPGIFGPGYDGRNDNERFALDLLYLEKTSFFGDIAMMVRQLLGKKINGSVIGHA